MTRGLKILAILALIAASGVATQSVFANCLTEGPYEVRQCAKGTWFAAAPGGSGAVAAAWWAIGYGNRNAITTAANPSIDGSGFLNLPLPGVFAGADSGILDAAGLDLADATTIPGLGAPAGSRCFSSSSNWGSPGMDSCIDVNRTSTAGGAGLSVSDNYVNKYWDVYLGGYPYYGPETLNHQLDPPMAVLLTEGSGQYFAAAFFASVPKLVPRETDLDPGQYHMDKIGNGDTDHFGGLSAVAWQPIPTPNISAVLSNPLDPSSVRNLSLDWAAPRFLHDNSTRPCFELDGTTPCASVFGGGVGVNEQGPLMHFEVEMVAMDLASVCGTAWTTVPGSKVDYPANATVANGVPQQSCVRLKTTFGKTPTSAMRTTATVAVRDLNRLDAQTGKLGDLGYFVVSAATKVGGPLVSQHASLTAVSRQRSDIRVVFSTDAELSINSFDVVGIDNKGGRKVIGTVACKQCTTGLSASYDELISGAKLQGAKKVQVVIQPSGVPSNTLDLK
jgi:hypothetical protein